MSKRVRSRFIVGWLAAVMIVVAGACGSGSGSSSSSADCGNEASDNCTPTVRASQSLTVDAITYRLKGASTAGTVGDPALLGAKAKGVFVIIKLRAKSNRKETGTFSQEMFKLVAGGKEYSADDAAITAFDQNFFYEDIGPDTSATGKLAFDVAPKVLNNNPKLKIGELGFGSTYGYIELPNVKR